MCYGHFQECFIPDLPWNFRCHDYEQWQMVSQIRVEAVIDCKTHTPKPYPITNLVGNIHICSLKLVLLVLSQKARQDQKSGTAAIKLGHKNVVNRMKSEPVYNEILFKHNKFIICMDELPKSMPAKTETCLKWNLSPVI